MSADEGNDSAARLIGYVFNTSSQDVTVFEVASHRVLATRPLGATVRWLSTEQRYWDGQYIWTYDFPEGQVQAIAVEPREVRLARTIPTGGAGPAHSLMLTPDLRTAWVNLAGEDSLAAIDLPSGQVVTHVTTGRFP